VFAPTLYPGAGKKPDDDKRTGGMNQGEFGGRKKPLRGGAPKRLSLFVILSGAKNLAFRRNVRRDSSFAALTQNDNHGR
jgi:hypothetical protein